MATLIENTLSVREDFEKQHDHLVREEIETFRQKANAFLAGEIPEDEFRPFRLKHGIYGQRQPGVQMVRCKVPGGLMTAAQMEQLARISETFAGGKGHITTRQNMQYHFVPLAQVPDVMHMLADVGLTNREACYNTVRNVTTCALAGLSRDEVFDVRPYAQRIAYAFLRKDLTSNLPRKFKIAFDGCRNNDCIAGAINDIGLRAVVRDGRRGFRVSHRRRAGTAAHRSPTARRVPARRAPDEPLRSRGARVQQVRQPPEPQQGAHEVRAARARHRLAARADRARVRRYSGKRRHRLARAGAGGLRRIYSRTRRRWGKARCCRSSTRTALAIRNTIGGSKPTSSSRSRPAMRRWWCAWIRAI